MHRRHCRPSSLMAVVAMLAIWLSAAVAVMAAGSHSGQVIVNGVPVPGATVTATLGERRVSTTTDADGVYRFAELPDGTWSLRVEMLGFEPASREVTMPGDAMPIVWELRLLPYDVIARGATTIAAFSPSPQGTTPAPAARTPSSSGFQRADVTTSPAQARTVARAEEPPAGSDAASDGLLINGSVNNGAASPFAQPAAFGNNRRRAGALYTGALGVLAGNSALDARPFSFTGRPAPRQDYSDLHLLATFQGPLKIPGVVQKRPNLFVGYQRTADHNATTQATIVPTLLERQGDFSQTIDPSGRALLLRDPATGLPFADNRIPATRISPVAAALLQYYPAPNVSDGRFNYQRARLTETAQDSLQSRVTQPIDTRNQLLGTAAYQRTATDTTSIFGFDDRTVASTVDATVTWTHRFSQALSLRPRFQFTRQATATTPYFADRSNVSGAAGITGNDQSPANWGPPALIFSSGIASLTDALPADTRAQTALGGGEALLGHGRHFLTFGGDLRQQRVAIDAQQDPRGRLSFSGARTGSDVADFLLGLPQTSALAVGNSDKRFSAWSADGYITDDYRVSPSLTINAGVRWEFEAPMTERAGRLVNLDVADGFAAIAPVIATNPVGPLSGERFRGSLLRADVAGLQPRAALAWRPIPGSSTVVRAGYGIYRNTNVYQPIATLLSQQPPLSRAFSVQSTETRPLTLASPFSIAPASALNTFAVDPAFRVGYAHTFQVSVQRDLPASLTVTATYLGTRGRHLLQEFLPNSYPPGAANPCASCPIGFVYLTSNGHSTRDAGQVQLRRRLRNGLTWTTQYTLARARDNAASYAAPTLLGSAIAQDWRDLDAEWGPSSFDQRHSLTAQAEYTTGVGARGGGLLTGVKGALINGWTMSAQLTAASGFPVTPTTLIAVPGTAVLGSVRAALTGASTAAIPDGAYLNPAAYAVPAPGQWGNAGRNSVRGPAQFQLNAALTRTFPWGSGRNWDWRIDALNVLNRVTYSAINAVVGTPQFGLPTDANAMRKLQTSLRLRF